MSADIAHADLTGVTRFDLCQFLKVRHPFSVSGKIGALEQTVTVDNKTPILQLLRKVGGDNFGSLEEKEKGPEEASFFIIKPDAFYPTLLSVNKMVRAYDLKLATAREMASFSLSTKGVLPIALCGVPFHVCGMDIFSCGAHVLFFPCSETSGKLHGLEHTSTDRENFEGERRVGYQESPRYYLVRRMTKEEIVERQDLP